jgi:hypothetical protein
LGSEVIEEVIDCEAAYQTASSCRWVYLVNLHFVFVEFEDDVGIRNGSIFWIISISSCVASSSSSKSKLTVSAGLNTIVSRDGDGVVDATDIKHQT